MCPIYKIWKDILKRCYDPKHQARNPTYVGCWVDPAWSLFSNFKIWVESCDWKGKQLDKDLLGDGKLYSPSTCLFITSQLNKFIATGRSSGELLTGVTFDKRSGKYSAQCHDPTGTFTRHVGTFLSEQDAHNAYVKRKSDVAKRIADSICDRRIAEGLLKKYA